jgi:hypothetical protein
MEFAMLEQVQPALKYIVFVRNVSCDGDIRFWQVMESTLVT